MATQSSSLPPLPTDSNMAPANAGLDAPGAGGPPSSPFSGGLPGMMQAIQQIEAGYKMLANMLPSLAPIAADAISKLRMAVPNAIGAVAGQGGAPQPGGATGLPAPPTGGPNG